ncbi:MAG: hypothetical protein FWD37_04655 [Methanomassiliicoccaceae archaeon]|nr:hypothetical protein [Methanomassiliicoccaceae archaeon]
MSILKKTFVIAFVMIALLIPVAALSDSAAGEVKIDGDINVRGGFDDRTAGTVIVTVHNSDDENDSTISILIVDLLNEDIKYAEVSGIEVPAGKALDVPIKFRVGSSGTHYAKVIISGDDVDDEAITSSLTFSFDVGRSIWSNTTTYIAIVIAILVVVIAVVLKMRSAPKVEEAGAFTAMEEERKAGRATKRSGADKEEYRGRKKE